MIVDILVGAVLLVSAVIALFRGFIREILTILGVLGGTFCAYAFGDNAAALISDLLKVDPENPQRLFGVLPYDLLALALGYGLVFIIVVGLLSLLSHFLAESVKNIGLGAIDRSLGAVFGLVRGAVLLGLLYLPVHMLVEKETKDKWFEGSRTYIYLEKTAIYMSGFVPSSAFEEVEAKAKASSDGLGDVLGAREKLQQIDVLKQEDLEEFKAKTKGYDEEFRQRMDELFEDQSGSYNE